MQFMCVNAFECMYVCLCDVLCCMYVHSCSYDRSINAHLLRLYQCGPEVQHFLDDTTYAHAANSPQGQTQHNTLFAPVCRGCLDDIDRAKHEVELLVTSDKPLGAVSAPTHTAYFLLPHPSYSAPCTLLTALPFRTHSLFCRAPSSAQHPD